MSAELLHLPLDLQANGLRGAGDNGAVGKASLEIRTARHVQAWRKPGLAVFHTQPIQVCEMHVRGRLAEAARLGVRIADKNVPLHANRRATRKFRLGVRRPPAFLQGGLISIDIGFRDGRRPQSHEVEPISPAQVEPIVFDEPYQNGG